MAGYSRQSVADIIAGAVVKAAPINAELNALRDTFAFSTGHTHDGSSTEGAYVPLIADVDALNKVVVDTTNNRISFYSEVSSTAVEQIRIQDGKIVPVTDDDIDLGAVGAEFKDLYIDGIGYIDSVVITGGTIDGTVIGGTTPAAADFTTMDTTGNATVGGNLAVTGTTALTGTATITSADINSGAMDNTTIGATTAAAGTFTNLTATGTSTLSTVDINAGAIDGTTIGSSSPAAITGTTITSTGLGTFPSVNIDGGAIDGTTIGATSAAAGSFTTVTTSGQATLATADINGGTIDGAVIGGSSAAAITGTTITGTSLVGPLTGAVTGNVTGNLTGNVTGNVTGDLTGNVTAATGSSTFNNVTVNGTLDVTGTTIANVTDPTSAQDAATKNYVDTNDALKLNLTGGTMSGAIAMGTNKITGLGTPTATADAATKGYVDTSVANLVDSAPAALDTLNELAAAIGDDANFSTTITNSIATKLPLAGGTMSGDIAMGTNSITGMADPTLAQDAATKAYVDTADALKLNLSGGTMSGAIAMGTNGITGMADPTANQDAATKAYVDTQDATKLSLSGGTMTGAIDMGSSKITTTYTPTDAADLTTKTYVDGILGSATAAATSAANAATSETNAATSETNAANSASAAATSEANAAASYDSFDDRYLGAKSSAPTLDNDGDALVIGALYFNTTTNIMYVYSSSGWQAAGSSVNGTTERQTYTATSGQTTFAVTYDVGYVDVWLNGVKLLAGTDFTATSGTSIVLTTGATVGDIVDIVAYGTFVLANHLTETQSDARYVNVTGDTMTGDLTIGGNATVGTDTAGLLSLKGGSTTSPQVRFFDGGTGRARIGVPTGQSYLSLSGSDSLTADVAIDSSGNLLVAKTAASLSTTGVQLNAEGSLSAVKAGTTSYFNRLTTDGEITRFLKDGTTVGSIQSRAGAVSTIILDPSATGGGISGGGAALYPTDHAGTLSNGALSLGDASYKFNNLHLSGTANATTVDLGNWTITEDGSGNLLFATGGTNKMKLDSSGNLTCVGDVTAFGTI